MMTMRRISLAFLLAVAGLVAVPAPAQAVDYQCIGAPANEPNGGIYPQPRQFVESQAWWSGTPNDFGHAHLGACIPERETLTGITSLKVRLVLHHNPGTIRYASLVVKGTDYETTILKVVPPQRTCPVADTCEQWVDMPLDAAKFGHSGLQEVRFRLFLDEPDGNSMHSSLNWQTYVQNGKSVSNVTRMPYLRAKGWYTGYGYCEPDVTSVPLPDGPVSGVWQPRVKQVDHGSTDVDPSYHRVVLDSDAHAGIPGTVLVEGPGPLPETTLSIDTTTLANGRHRLVQRVDCQQGTQTNSGVLVTAFTVAN